jgi:hypothetical protein
LQVVGKLKYPPSAGVFPDGFCNSQEPKKWRDLAEIVAEFSVHWLQPVAVRAALPTACFSCKISPDPVQSIPLSLIN